MKKTLVCRNMYCKLKYVVINLKLLKNIVILRSFGNLKCKWNFLETPIQSVQRSLNLLFERTLFLMFSFFQKYLNPQVRAKKLVDSVVYHTCPSGLASRIHPFIFL